MCYVDSVGVRELRQNLSVYLRRVAAGEALRVTEHGRPVAVLAPVAANGDDPLSDLIAAGRLTAVTGSLADLPPPPRLRGGLGLSAALAALRDEDTR